MKTQYRNAIITASVFLMFSSFSVCTVKAEPLPEETITAPDSTAAPDNVDALDSVDALNSVDMTDSIDTLDSVNEPDSADALDSINEPDSADALDSIDVPDSADAPDEDAMSGLSLSETAPVPAEAPPFRAHLEFRMGYMVIGTFTDFTTDITLVQTMCSLDGENWQTVNAEWNLASLGTDNESSLYSLQNQPCLFPIYEPLKSYLEGTIDRFYVKLRITRENGLFYDTQSAVIERGDPKPIPEGAERGAWFSSGIAVHEPAPDSPHHYIGYGRYQITVPADAAAEEIAALLPDTLPVEIRFRDEQGFLAIGTVDCPITWKPLSLSALSSGESITIPDAAEEIVVPSGTLISTPLGIFQLDEPLSLDTPPTTDEIRLVLNVGPESKNPTGVLREGKDGLEVAFHYKPTGAVSIQTYVLTEGENVWTELSGLSLLDELQQPSTANSGYALVLRNDQEPYRSYLNAAGTGQTPAPFFIGLKIEGGIYDGKQLILPWPDIYEKLPDLPKISGAGGNEGNAGADDKNDSTVSGQRPNLPQTADDPQEQTESPPLTADDLQEQTTNPPLTADNSQEQATNPPLTADAPQEQQTPDGSQEKPKSASSETADSGRRQENGNDTSAHSHPAPQEPADPDGGQRPNLPLTAQATGNTFSANNSALADQENRGLLEPFAGPVQTTLVVQAASDTANEDDNPAFVPKEGKIAGPGRDSHEQLPVLPLAVILITGGCICAAVCKASGYRLLVRFAGKLRNTLRK